MFELDTPIPLNAAMDFEVRCDLIHLPGTDEDGQPAVGETFYVVATAGNGRRWAHSHWFDKHGMVDYEEGRFSGIIDSGAEAKAEALRTTIANSGKLLNPDHWSEIDPMYGSEAYQRLDATKFFRNREIFEAFEDREITAQEAIDHMLR